MKEPLLAVNSRLNVALGELRGSFKVVPALARVLFAPIVSVAAEPVCVPMSVFALIGEVAELLSKLQSEISPAWLSSAAPPRSSPNDTAKTLQNIYP